MNYDVGFQLPVAISCEPVFESKREEQKGVFFIYVNIYFDQDEVIGDIDEYGVEFNMCINKAYLRVEVSSMYAQFLARYNPNSKEALTTSSEQKNVMAPHNPQIKRFEGGGSVQLGITPLGLFSSLSGKGSVSWPFEWGGQPKNKGHKKISVELKEYARHHAVWKITTEGPTGLTGSVPLPQRGNKTFQTYPI